MYCVKCKKKYNPTATKTVTLSNGRKALTSNCPKCGTKGFQIKAG